MQNKDISLELFCETLYSAILNTEIVAELLQRRYSSLSQSEAYEIANMFRMSHEMEHTDSAELVITAPRSFSMKIKATKDVVESLLRNAEKKILLTGYSISSYFDEMINVLVDKSQSGVFVKIFLNQAETKDRNSVSKLMENRSAFLKVYEYVQKEDDQMSALHAKVIVTDDIQSLITSANLSYHGQKGNIEIGALISSSKTAKEIDEVFTYLIFKKIFQECN